MEDDQEKFANMKLEFEEVKSDEESDNQDDAAVLHITEESDESPADERPPIPQFVLNPSPSQELALPATRNVWDISLSFFSFLSSRFLFFFLSAKPTPQSFQREKTEHDENQTQNEVSGGSHQKYSSST